MTQKDVLEYLSAGKSTEELEEEGEEDLEQVFPAEEEKIKGDDGAEKFPWEDTQ
jgi:hypothetical protein